MLIKLMDLMKKSVQLYQENFGLFLKYIVLNIVVPMLMALIVGFLVAFVPIFMMGTGMNTIIIIILSLAIVVGAVAMFYVASWFSATFIKVINDKHLNKPVMTVKENLKTIRPLIWRMIGASILSGLFIALPVLVALIGTAIMKLTLTLAGIESNILTKILEILFVLIGIYGIFHAIYFGVKLQFSTYGVLFDNKKPVESLKYSSSLVAGRWWGIFGRVFASGLLLFIIVFVVQLILETIGDFTGSIGTALMAVINWLFSVIVWQTMIMLVVILYNNLKNTPSITPETKPTTSEPPLM